MKNVVTGIMMSIMMALFIIIILTTDDRTIRINEVNTALADALDESLNVLDINKYSIADTDELIADVTQGLLVQIESDAAVIVNVMDADKDKGIVTIEAVENFRKASGAAGQTAATRTILLEKQQVQDTYDEDNRQYNITYLNTDGTEYITYSIKKNEQLIIPITPDNTYWEYNENPLDTAVNVVSDMIIQAKN
uniref:hypothetical protein n=1 Tax=[Lactobacillus] rogosae TaxID=706562 RepID=UPI00402AC43A